MRFEFVVQKLSEIWHLQNIFSALLYNERRKGNKYECKSVRKPVYGVFNLRVVKNQVDSIPA